MSTGIGKPDTVIACRVHDECNGSDVFGSDICTCRPYLAHGVEVCAATAQQGGVGLVVYNRKEGRALGEVTKFLVYNARKRQRGGDRAETYFHRTECVAGVQDMRFQELMPDVFHWLGIAPHRPLGVDVEHEARGAAGPGHRDRRAGARSRTGWCRSTRRSRSRRKRPPGISPRPARRAGRAARHARGRGLDA